MQDELQTKILRKLSDIISMSYTFIKIIDYININDRKIKLPFTMRVDPRDNINIKINVFFPQLDSDERYLLFIDMTGIGVVSTDDIEDQTIDPGHKFIFLRNKVENIEINASSTSFFGSSMWNFTVSRVIISKINWKKFSYALYLKNVVKYYIYRNDEIALEKILDSLYSVHETPNILQIAAASIMGHNTYGDYEQLVDFYSIPISDASLADLKFGTYKLESLEKVSDQVIQSMDGDIYLMGHCHIDAAWLWPYSETRKKVKRSFLNTLKLYREGYSFVYAQSSALYYKWIEDQNKVLFDEIKHAVANGMWLPVGGMWVESDTNLVLGESLARQFLFGQDYFREKFGRYSRIGWLPDTFGFSAQLPQIMAESHIEVFITHKLRWNDTTYFPYNFFVWTGIDGTYIPSILVNETYNGNMEYDQIAREISGLKKMGKPYVYPYGYGDGGGGPNVEMIELMQFLPNLVKGTHQLFSEGDFLKDVKHASESSEKVAGELYVENHRGTYTTNNKIKKKVSQLEDLLISADFVSSVGVLKGSKCEPNALRKEWETLLTAEFHDVIPGSANYFAYLEAFADLDNAIAETLKYIEEKMTDICEKYNLSAGYVVLNQSQYQLNTFLDLSKNAINLEAKRTDSYGYIQAEPFCVTVERELTEIVNPCINDVPFKVEQTDRYIHVTTKIYDFWLNLDGSFKIDNDGKNIIHNAATEIMEDLPAKFDAWNIDYDTLEKRRILNKGKCNIMYEDEGSFLILKSNVTYEDGSTIIQKFILNSLNKVVEVENNIKLSNREKLVKTFFNSSVMTKRLICEIPFGVIERDFEGALNNPKFEFPALRFVNWSDASNGFSLVSRDLHGYSFVNGELGITLAKIPLYPNPFSDIEGVVNTFYILLDKDYKEVFKQCNFIFHPPIIYQSKNKKGRSSKEKLFPVEETGVEIEAIKPAKSNDGLIVRSYAFNKPAKLKFNFATISDIYKTDITEDTYSEKLNGDIDYNKFEIKTLFLRVKD
ncbi:MAG: glycosyl hydrolase-related protein [Thermoplasmatales archaeon]|nr:glycosyl hydrolase-related protein [Thermoplasmatales archaeon]